MDSNNFFQIKNKYGSIFISYNIISIYVHTVLKKFRDYLFKSFFVSYLKDDFHYLELSLQAKKTINYNRINEISKQITILFRKLLNLKIVIIVKI